MATPTRKREQSSSDLERYHYYVREEVSADDLAPFPEHTLPAVHSHLAPGLLGNPDWSDVIESLHQEIVTVSQ